MRRPFAGGCTRLFECRVQPKQVGREDSHGRVDDRRRIALVGGFPAVVIGRRRNASGGVLDAVPELPSDMRSPRRHVRGPPGDGSERRAAESGSGSPPSTAACSTSRSTRSFWYRATQYRETPAVSSRESRTWAMLDPADGHPACIGDEDFNIAADVPHATEQTHDRGGPPRPRLIRPTSRREHPQTSAHTYWSAEPDATPRADAQRAATSRREMCVWPSDVC